MDWARILAHVTGTVDQELLARNEYLAAENLILKAQLKGRLNLSNAERATLGEIGHRLGRKVLGEVATVARPDTILAWYRKLVASKFDGSKARRGSGRPQITREVEQLIVRMASENRSWGYDRIVGALANLGFEVSDQTVGNVLRRHALPPAPERKRTTTWQAFIRTLSLLKKVFGVGIRRRPIVEYVFLGRSVHRGHLRRVRNEWKFRAPLHASTTVEKCSDPSRRSGCVGHAARRS